MKLAKTEDNQSLTVGLVLLNAIIFFLVGFWGYFYFKSDIDNLIQKSIQVLPFPSSQKTDLSLPNILPVEFQLDLPTLTYHYIRVVENPEVDKLGFALSVTPENFKKQMQYLVDHDYQTISPDDLYNALKEGKNLPPKSVLLTFDDGYRDFYQNAFPVLKKHNLKATVFVVTNFVGDKDKRYLTWEQIKEMDKSDLVMIGSHSQNHANLIKSSKATQEISQSKAIIEKQLGHEISTFAYPGGQFNAKVANLVSKATYQLAFTTQIGTKMSFEERFQLPRVRISGGLPIGKFPEKLLPQK